MSPTRRTDIDPVTEYTREGLTPQSPKITRSYEVSYVRGLEEKVNTAVSQVDQLTLELKKYQTTHKELEVRVRDADERAARAVANFNTAQKKAEALEATVADLKKQNEALRFQLTGEDATAQLLAELQDKYELLSKQYNLLRSQVEGSFASDELAAYFNNAIASFNEQMNTTEASVRYRVNSMDVDLKAQISKSGDELRFLTRGEDGTSAVSTVKISIAAVPNT